MAPIPNSLSLFNTQPMARGASGQSLLPFSHSFLNKYIVWFKGWLLCSEDTIEKKEKKVQMCVIYNLVLFNLGQDFKIKSIKLMHDYVSNNVCLFSNCKPHKPHSNVLFTTHDMILLFEERLLLQRRILETQKLQNSCFLTKHCRKSYLFSKIDLCI